MSDAVAAYGVLLKLGNAGSPETFTTLAEVKSISGPNMSTDVIDVTTHSSAAIGAGREKLASLIDWGEITFDLNFIPSNAQHIAVRKIMEDRSKRNFQIVFPDQASTTWQANCYVTSFECDMPVDDVLGASLTLTITTKPTFNN